jgi:hypothetical protein
MPRAGTVDVVSAASAREADALSPAVKLRGADRGVGDRFPNLRGVVFEAVTTRDLQGPAKDVIDPRISNRPLGATIIA